MHTWKLLLAVYHRFNGRHKLLKIRVTDEETGASRTLIGDKHRIGLAAFEGIHFGTATEEEVLTALFDHKGPEWKANVEASVVKLRRSF